MFRNNSKLNDSKTLIAPIDFFKCRNEISHFGQNTFTKRVDGLRADLKTISSAVKANPALLTGDLKTKFDTARMNLSLLTRDGSKGAHNFEYATRVMDQAGKDLEKA
jgi:hypothetical protein